MYLIRTLENGKNADISITILHHTIHVAYYFEYQKWDVKRVRTTQFKSLKDNFHSNSKEVRGVLKKGILYGVTKKWDSCRKLDTL